MRIEEEREARRKVIHIQPGIDRRLDVGNAVRQREGNFLYSRAPGLPDMVAADADGIPPGHLICRKAEGIGDQAHGGPRRKDIGTPGHVFLQNVVLNRAPELRRRHALRLRDGDVHRP